MKKILLGLALMIAGSTYTKAQGLDGIVVEKFYVSTAADGTGSSSAGGGTLPTGSITWRFYVDLAAGWELQSVYGDALHTLNFSSTTPFYNNEDRGATNANAIPFNNIDDNTVILDSYISVGGTCSNRLGVVKSEDDATGQLVFGAGLLANTDPSIGQPVNVRDGQTGVASAIDAVTIINLATELGAVLDNVSLAGSALTTNNGAWSNLNGSEGPTTTNRVLIAQITTTGVLTYAINIQIRNTTTLQVVNYVSSNPQGTEVTDPSLSGVLNQPNTAPTVSITAPTAGSTYLVGAPVTIDATAADADGSVTNVEFLVDGSVVGSDNTAPYTFTWTATLGSHNLTARATDNGGATTTSGAVNILVGSVIPPTVSITSPATGSTFVLGDVVTIDATAADADGTVSQVEFFVDGTSVGTDNTSPYSVNWAAALGVHSLTAVATDDDNATTTSSAISINVFDSSAAYVIESSNNPCSQTNFCLPVIAIAPVNDVIGYDIVLQYDNSKVAPTGVITISSDLITPSYVSTASSVNAGSGLMYISVFFNANAPLTAEFNGTGDLLCVEFARTSGFGANDTADFNVTSLQESYYTGVEPKVVSPGSYSTFQESEFNSRLQFWSDGSAIKYDASNPSTYLITNIYGVDSACGNQSATAVQPDLLGEFVYDYANGPYININKDIPNAISVQPVINGFDGFLTRRVLINDATFVPSVYQMIAMDVNTDGVVSAGDLSQVLQRAVLTIGEFRQDWNYGNGGVSNGQPSKDWLFIDASTISGNPAFQISTTFPFDDGIGYSKSSVPTPDFCIEIPYNTTATCNSFGLETYTGILVGDVNGNYATNTTGGPFRLSDDKKVVFDLTQAVAVEGGYEVPVVAVSNEAVNALDFAINMNENKVQYSGVAQKAAYLESEVNFNTNDRTVRFSSYSLQNYELNTAVATVRFLSSEAISAEDITSAVAYLNGEEVIAEVIGSRLSTEEVQVSVFPNPASGSFNVVSSENVNIQLMDANGRVIIAMDNMNAYQKYEFSTSELAAGVYLLKVFGADFVSVKKVVIK